MFYPLKSRDIRHSISRCLNNNFLLISDIFDFPGLVCDSYVLNSDEDWDSKLSKSARC